MSDDLKDLVTIGDIPKQSTRQVPAKCNSLPIKKSSKKKKKK